MVSVELASTLPIEMHEKWRLWNQWGLIPGPSEREEVFLKRGEFCLGLKEYMRKNPKLFPEGFSGSKDETCDLAAIFAKTQALYGIAPYWTPLVFSNEGLTPWQGGCAVIFQMSQEGPLGAWIQLRQSFAKASALFGVYTKQELLAHELAHVARMAFHESRYEEFFAYQAAPSAFRRFLGPLVTSSLESAGFVLCLFLSFLSDMAAFFSPFESFFFSLSWGLKGLTLVLVAFALGRLFWRHYELRRCFKQLVAFLPQEKARQLLFRLSDREIKLFGKLAPEEIQSRIKSEAEQSFRWRFLHAAYEFKFL